MQFSISQVAGAILTAATVSAAASWYLRGEQIDVLKEQLHAYETAQDLNLNDLTLNAQAAIESLKLQLARMNELDQLKEQILSLEEELSAKAHQVETLSDELAEKDKTIGALDSQVKSLFSEYQQFTLGRGQVRKLFEGKFTLSVAYVTSDSADIVLNNQMSRVTVGQYLDVSSGTRKCKMTLEGVSSWATAAFSVLCDKT